MKSPVTFAKIVPTPTMSAWSQAYNAGNLAAVVSLTTNTIENKEGEEIIHTEVSLASLGKQLLNTLEAEYFTLETKNLNTIKQAIVTTCEKAEDDVVLSLLVSVIIENILYVFVYGDGKILMKRNGKLGVLLEQERKGNLVAASGFIENNDIVILETIQFANIVSTDTLLPCLEHDKLTEMAEILSPIIHEKQDGSASCIAFSYRETDAPVVSKTEPEVLEDKPEEKPIEEQNFREAPEETATKPQLETEVLKENEDFEVPEAIVTAKKRRITLHFSHSRRLFLTIAIILVCVLAGSIFFSLQKQKQAKLLADWNASIVPVQQKYTEGQSLIDVNKNLAREDFQNAKDMLASAKGKFPSNSSQAKQIADLEKNIDSALAGVSAINSANTKLVDSSSSDLLATLIKYPDARYATFDDKNIYLADANGVTSVNRTTGKETSIIKNSDDWKSIGGFGTYLGNFYILDKTDGILKYIPSGSTFSKSSYFPTTAPDLSKATDIAIDGSIWILNIDGTITKYTRGKPDDFSLKGLDKPLSSPTRIFTSVDANNVYIMDNGNSRIVVVDKNGNYVAQYQSSLLQTAQAFDVIEKNKVIYILSSGKIYEIDLQ